MIALSVRAEQIAAHLVGHETGARVIPHDVDCRPSPDAKKVATNLRIIQQLIETEGVGVVEAAKTFGWPKATYYQHRSSQLATS